MKTLALLIISACFQVLAASENNPGCATKVQAQSQHQAPRILTLDRQLAEHFSEEFRSLIAQEVSGDSVYLARPEGLHDLLVYLDVPKERHSQILLGMGQRTLDLVGVLANAQLKEGSTGTVYSPVENVRVVLIQP